MTLEQSLILVAKILFVLTVFLLSAAYATLLERRESAWIQNRVGPNRVGWGGALQPFADVLKLLLKEDIIPLAASRPFHLVAPMISIAVAVAAWMVLPFAAPFHIGDTLIYPAVAANLDFGLLIYLALSSVGVYGIALAGWASNNKYSLFGGLRSAAQMISYELSLGLSLMGIFLLSGSLDLGKIAADQSGYWFGFLPTWYIFLQPFAFIIFFVAALAETNRHPFDLAEAEPELVGGFHTEYTGLKFGLFFLAEYGNMILMSALIATLFFGGFNLPWLQDIAFFRDHEILRAILQFAALMVKITFFTFVFIWIRWSIPRFRYDQLMNLGWRVMFPLALANTVVTAIVIALLR